MMRERDVKVMMKIIIRRNESDDNDNHKKNCKSND